MFCAWVFCFPVEEGAVIEVSDTFVPFFIIVRCGDPDNEYIVNLALVEK